MQRIFSSSQDSNHLANAFISGSCAVSTLLAVQLFTSADPIGKSVRFLSQLSRHEKKLTINDGSVDEGIDEYTALHREEPLQTRNSNYRKLVNAYYDLSTVFYEWGWGASFHFAYRLPHETFDESIRRHEYQLASQLNTYQGNILDIGCGIGGPMRNISKFLQSRVQGITLNPYQVERCNELNAKDPISDCHVVQGDFMELPFELESFDSAYAIEATCHAPDRAECYSQIYRVLKPGAHFAAYEWCLTDAYDPTNPEHERLKKDIEVGNGLPDICERQACLRAMEKAGFEILRATDLGEKLHPLVEPWQTPLCPSWNPLSQRFQFNRIGGHLTNVTIWLLEKLWLAPTGTVKTQKVLQAGGFALRDAANQGIFTTQYLIVGRRPTKNL